MFFSHYMVSVDREVLMKIKLSSLKPNPFRNIKQYPIHREKVEALTISIKETSFWDNLLARKQGNRYELAYGHHRLIALQELGIEEIDIPVRDLDDATMIRIMASENLEEWRHSTKVINETVKAAKEYLDSELVKYETWEECPNKSIKALFNGTKGDFLHAKNKGVGQTTLLKFLGKNWKQHQIQRALAILNNEEVDREAVETFDNPNHADAFRILLEKSRARPSGDDMARSQIPSPQIPKDQQKSVAEAIKTALESSNIELTTNSIQQEFKQVLIRDREETDRELIDGMTEQELIQDYIDGKVSDLEDILRSFVRRFKKLSKELEENEPDHDKDLIEEKVFLAIVRELDTAVEACGYDLRAIIDKARR